MILGRHVSIGSSIANSVAIAKSLNCNAIQIFTRNPRGWQARELSKSDISAFKEARKGYMLDAVVSHMPYLPNLASPNAEMYNKSVDTLLGEVERCDALGIEYLVLHLGSHMNIGAKEGAAKVVEAVSKAVSKSKDTFILLENQAGQKNTVGSKIEELVAIADGIGHRKVGFCLDTCHAFAAGYDMRKTEVVDDLVEKLGRERVRVVHLNDAMEDLGSFRDRHQNIGFGKIGKEGIANIINCKSLKGKVFILETPVGDNISEADEIRLVFGLSKK